MKAFKEQNDLNVCVVLTKDQSSTEPVQKVIYGIHTSTNSIFHHSCVSEAASCVTSHFRSVIDDDHRDLKNSRSKKTRKIKLEVEFKSTKEKENWVNKSN